MLQKETVVFIRTSHRKFVESWGDYKRSIIISLSTVTFVSCLVVLDFFDQPLIYMSNIGNGLTII